MCMAVIYLGKQSINFVTDQYDSLICASCTVWVSTSPHTPHSHSPHVFKSGTDSILAETLSKSYTVYSSLKMKQMAD
jgi:hypothetical protein